MNVNKNNHFKFFEESLLVSLFFSKLVTVCLGSNSSSEAGFCLAS